MFVEEIQLRNCQFGSFLNLHTRRHSGLHTLQHSSHPPPVQLSTMIRALTVLALVSCAAAFVSPAMRSVARKSFNLEMAFANGYPGTRRR
jgi:hypothetical protein